ncbi:SapC family protein [Roseateles koreensis]|uniref:SapC family protein n=1 Tax=Roseateles koreensis TaxID=2987526 RepID=A0ABT5KTH2_9BURK|nr:SapC family protein [Roseateles koreensis]MDC8786242.1 SapC family protein [Roseateles koreensis]
MSTPPLYGNLVPLDREAHKHLRLKTELSTVERAAGLNSLFLAVVEFAEACKEFPIVFVRVGEVPTDGSKQSVAPLAVLGLKAGSNLFVKDGQWTGNYMPAYLRRYPFAMARVGDDPNTVAVCYDSEWAGFSVTEGQSLFAADGQPTEFLVNARNFLENFEQESERTRNACHVLMELDLLQDMRFEATLGNGEKLDVEGFLAVDEKKLAALPDEKVVELHRNGLLALIEIHRLSMTNMTRLATLEINKA